MNLQIDQSGDLPVAVHGLIQATRNWLYEAKMQMIISFVLFLCVQTFALSEGFLCNRKLLRKSYYIKKRSAKDATGAQRYMQAKACAHQRAKSCVATLRFFRRQNPAI